MTYFKVETGLFNIIILETIRGEVETYCDNILRAFKRSVRV